MKRTWTNNQLIDAVKISDNYSELARNLGLRTKGANMRTIKRVINELNLDISHFLSVKDLLKRSREKINHMTYEDLFRINKVDRKHIKKIILRDNLIPYKCNKCGITDWLGEKLSLHLDHINGINNDNRLENLQFLCPNCHSLTDTYCGKNLKQEIVENKCINCKITITKNYQKCKSCAGKLKNNKIIWPSTQDLINMVNKYGYSATSRNLGVSDNAVRKHIITHPI